MTRTGLCLGILTGVLAVVWCGGCQEGQQAQQGSDSDVKMHRLIAAENKELRAKLATETERRDNEIQNLKGQLAKCQEEKQDWQNKAERELKEQVEGVVSVVIQENAALKEELARTQAELEKMKGQQTAQPEAGEK